METVNPYSRKHTVEYRLSTRVATCRVCAKDIKPKTEKMITWYSYSNRGQHIHICADCVRFLNELVVNGDS